MELNPNYPFLTPSPKHLSHKTPTNTKQHNTNTYYWEGWQGAGRQLFFTNQNNANLKPLVLRGALGSCRVGEFDGKRPLFFFITDMNNNQTTIPLSTYNAPFSRTTQPLPLSPLLLSPLLLPTLPFCQSFSGFLVDPFLRPFLRMLFLRCFKVFCVACSLLNTSFFAIRMPGFALVVLLKCCWLGQINSVLTLTLIIIIA